MLRNFILILLLQAVPARASDTTVQQHQDALARCLKRLELSRFAPTPAVPLISQPSIHAKLLAIEDFWRADFAKRGWPFHDLSYRLYSRWVQTKEGLINRKMGPVYNPVDQTLYLDLKWFDKAAAIVGPPSATSLVWIFAHEFGHHIQKILGVHHRVAAWAASLPPNDPARAPNFLLSKIEDQADCLAGVYLHTHIIKNPSVDFHTGLAAAIEVGLRSMMIGDDIMFARMGLPFDPNQSNHGTAYSRFMAVLRGMVYGDINQCEPFSFPVLTAPIQ